MRVTAAGSLPGTDFRGAVQAMAELLPEITPLPELPARGVGSDMIGRTLGLLDGLGFDLQPAGWRLVPNQATEQRRARAQWSRDLDDLEELLQGFDQTLKVGLAGPWTLASGVERPRGDRLLADHGARRGVAQALAEATTGLRAELARRLPGATLLVQIDEPSLPAVRSGSIPTASGFSRHRAVDDDELVAALRPLARDAVLHCCAPGRSLDLASRAGFSAVSIDTRLVDLDDLAEWCDEGRRVILGVVDTASGRPQGVDVLVRTALAVLRALQMQLTDELVLGTACGFGLWPIGAAREQLNALRRAAPLVAEQLSRG